MQERHQSIDLFFELPQTYSVSAYTIYLINKYTISLNTQPNSAFVYFNDLRYTPLYM